MLFNLPDYSLIAAILPIIWAIYLKHTSETGVQIHINNLDYRTTISIRNGSNNALFIDEAICYKSNHHKYRFYSPNSTKSLKIASGEECYLNLDTNQFTEFINTLDIGKKELPALRIKLYTSRGVLTTGWIRLNRNEESQYGFVFINNPRAIVLRTEMNPAYSEYTKPILAALIVPILILSKIIPYDMMSEIVLFILLLILIFGPFTFINGFKNGKTVSLKCISLSFLLSAMLAISAKDNSYIIMTMPFFLVIYLEAMICSGGMILDLENSFNDLPIYDKIKNCFHRKTMK